MPRRHSTFSRSLIWFLLPWLVAAWSGMPAALARAAALDQEKTAKAAVDLQRSLVAIEDGQRDAPRDRWDPQYVVDQVGVEPEALFQWVREHVLWVPYRGVLRGATGVLMDRVGNSLDIAVLLATLLETAGHEVRLAHADLSPDVAAKTFQSMQSAARTAAAQAPPGGAAAPPVAAAEAAADDVAAVADQYGADASAAAAEFSSNLDLARTRAASLDARVNEQSAKLLALLAAPDPTAARKAAADAAIAALRDHWWAEVRDGSDWKALDALDPSGAIGHALSTASSTVASSEVPAELVHHVTVRVIAEQWKGGKTHETTILEHTLEPSDTVGQRVVLTQMPLMWPADWKAVTPEDLQKRLFAALRSQTEWMPVLEVGDQKFGKASVKDTGEINPEPSIAQNPFLSVSVPAAGDVGRVADVFDDVFAEADKADRNQPGGASASEPKEAAREAGELSAEWIEYEVRVPGQAPRTIRREVFDLLGPARRAAGVAKLEIGDEQVVARAGAQLTETTLVILPCRLAPEYLMDLAARQALANKPLLDDFASDPFAKVPANFVEVLSKMAPLPGPAMAFATMRFQASATSGAVFVDQPAIVAEHGILVHTGPDTAVVNLGLDIVANGVGVDPFADADPFATRVKQGVADTNAEALVLAGNWPAPINTAESFAQSAGNRDPWQRLAPGDAGRVAQLGLGADLAARVSADLAAGRTVVVPKSGARTWWRVDPATGETLGMGPNGWGQSLVEYAFQLTIQLMLAEIACASFTGVANAKVEKLSEADETKAAQKQIGKTAVDIAKEVEDTAREAKKKGAIRTFKDKYKAWARSCVGQSMLNSLTGVTSSWIMSRFITGADLSRFRWDTPRGGPGPRPPGNPFGPETVSPARSGNTNPGLGPGPSGGAGPGGPGPSGGPGGPSGPGPNGGPKGPSGPIKGPTQPGIGPSNSSKGGTQPMGPNGGKGGTQPIGQKGENGGKPGNGPETAPPSQKTRPNQPEETAPPTERTPPRKPTQQDLDRLTQNMKDAHDAEVNAIKRYNDDPSDANSQAVKDAIEAADRARKAELGGYADSSSNYGASKPPPGKQYADQNPAPPIQRPEPPSTKDAPNLPIPSQAMPSNPGAVAPASSGGGSSGGRSIQPLGAQPGADPFGKTMPSALAPPSAPEPGPQAGLSALGGALQNFTKP